MDGVGCPACGGSKLITDPVTGEVACERCGMVVVEFLRTCSESSNNTG